MKQLRGRLVSVIVTDLIKVKTGGKQSVMTFITIRKKNGRKKSRLVDAATKTEINKRDLRLALRVIDEMIFGYEL